MVELSHQTLSSYTNTTIRDGRMTLNFAGTGSPLVMQCLLPDIPLPVIDRSMSQASAMDHALMSMFIRDSEYIPTCIIAYSYINNGRGDDILPFTVTRYSCTSAPISAKRWLSLASPGPSHSVQDGFSSSDLDDEVANNLGKIVIDKSEIDLSI